MSANVQCLQGGEAGGLQVPWQQGDTSGQAGPPQVVQRPAPPANSAGLRRPQTVLIAGDQQPASTSTASLFTRQTVSIAPELSVLQF